MNKFKRFYNEQIRQIFANNGINISKKEVEEHNKIMINLPLETLNIKDSIDCYKDSFNK